jgi:Mg-chelatase subunit ChlD
MAFGATMAQGQTIAIAAPRTTIQIPEAQVKTVAQHVKQVLGDQPVVFGYGQMTGRSANQREHVVNVMDISHSMDGEYDCQFTKLQAAIRANVTLVIEKAGIDPYDEVGIVVFDDSAQVMLPLSPLHSHKRQVIQTLQSLRSRGGTDINEGLKAAREVFDWSRTDVVRRIILLTDGQGGHPLGTAEDLKSRGVVIDVIGVGKDPSGVDEKLLRQVASVINGETYYRFIKDQKTLVGEFTRLARKTVTATMRN